jgi:hypothetical protein
VVLKCKGMKLPLHSRSPYIERQVASNLISELCIWTLVTVATVHQDPIVYAWSKKSGESSDFRSAGCLCVQRDRGVRGSWKAGEIGVFTVLRV